MNPRVIEIQESVTGHNDQQAARNRARFNHFGVYVINVMSAPGSGKTEFLARTLADAAEWGQLPSSGEPQTPLSGESGRGERLRAAVIVGDIATDNDARRLNRTGIEVVQITTGGYCHLDAGMVAEAVPEIDLRDLDLLIVENVGNMVCPATFDLGEHARVALISVTEGEDKPLKYPTLFKRADVIVVNKIDIAEVVGYDRDLALDNLRRVAPQARIFEVSARTGQGMSAWYDHLRSAAGKRRLTEVTA